MNEPLAPLPPDIVEKLATLSPPPAPLTLGAELLPSIRASGQGVMTGLPWWAARVPGWLPVATLLTGAAIGIGIGIGIDRAQSSRVAAPPIVITVNTRELAEDGIGSVPAQAPRPAPRLVPRRPLPPPPPPPLIEVPPEDRLREERVLIDIARAALRRDPLDGVTALQQHERDFPNGQLREERGALAVQLFLRLGRRADARARFDVFSREFPLSPLVGALDRFFQSMDGGFDVQQDSGKNPILTP